MSTIKINDPEVIYDSQSENDKLTRRILFLNDISNERCTMDPRPINEAYPVSYINGRWSGVSTGYHWVYTFGADITLPGEVLDSIVVQMGESNNLFSKTAYMVIDTEGTSWTAKAYHRGEISTAESTKGTSIEISGRIELYLQFMECRKHEDPTCYAETHGKTWQLKGKFVSGTIDLIS